MKKATETGVMVAIFFAGILAGIFRFDGLYIFCGLVLLCGEMTDCVNYYVKNQTKR